MSQSDFATIDPNVVGGVQLALLLNQWRDAVHTLHRGTERPSYATGGMLWAKDVSAERWDLMWFDGNADITLRSVNPQTGATLPIPVSQGGTGANSAEAAREALGVDEGTLDARYFQIQALGSAAERDAGGSSGNVMLVGQDVTHDANLTVGGSQSYKEVRVERRDSSGNVARLFLGSESGLSRQFIRRRYNASPDDELAFLSGALEFNGGRIHHAGMAVGEVGTYAFLRDMVDRVTNPGQTRSGGDLRYSSAWAWNGATPSGTWRCMGECQTGTSNQLRTTLWLRIA